MRRAERDHDLFMLVDFFFQRLLFLCIGDLCHLQNVVFDFV